MVNSQNTLNNSIVYSVDQDSCEYAFFTYTANQLLSLTNADDIWTFYQKVKSYSILQSQINLTNKVDFIFSDRLKKRLLDKPVIISFHYGLYRLLPLALLNHGYKICIMVSQDILNSQMAYYSSILNPNLFKNLAFIDAEQGGSFFQMREYAKRGYLLFIYADGASGVQNISIAKHHTTTLIRLQNGELRVRTGFADMAYLLQKGICVIFSPNYPKEDDYFFDYHDYYSPGEKLAERATFRNEVINSLYAHLDKMINADPFVFEGWFSLHDSVVRSNTNSYLLNTKARFSLYKEEQVQFILDKLTYKVYKVN